MSGIEGFSVRQVQAMVDRTYALAMNDVAAGIVQPWQEHIPSVHDLRWDLIGAGTWPTDEKSER